MLKKNTQATSTTEVTIDGKKADLDKNGEVKASGFTVKTSGQPLLSGIISQPVTIKQEHNGSQYSDSVDAILKMLSSPGFNT